ncbi:MAG: radical SAM protein [Rhodospirillaceae bacterium]|nr:radical SAM protein [Rhodospirillaceae bacterium]|tara:strand:+ start:9646 stop:10605 length:960 start_codon:yes stop_codon:yes gene_type:complete
MDGAGPPDHKPLDPAKFRDPLVTAAGDTRASVALDDLKTLWINTGTLCNLTCENCYIESSPRNDRLSYITIDEVRAYLDEIGEQNLATEEIGFTGGEPFMNPDMLQMLEETLSRGFRALVLTNAMRPMQRHEDALKKLKYWFNDKLVIRVSIDHYRQELHEAERGIGSWHRMLKGLIWLSQNDFCLDVAGRTPWGEEEAAMREGYAPLFAEHGISVDTNDPAKLVLFPEMDASQDVPEITEQCWSILNIEPSAMMCATSRMIVKRKGAEKPAVIACTLLPYDDQFELGTTLADSSKDIPLNHPHCAKFCVLGGGACSQS